jgi:hypothetical protein
MHRIVQTRHKGTEQTQCSSQVHKRDYPPSATRQRSQHRPRPASLLLAGSDSSPVAAASCSRPLFLHCSSTQRMRSQARNTPPCAQNQTKPNQSNLMLVLGCVSQHTHSSAAGTALQTPPPHDSLLSQQLKRELTNPLQVADHPTPLLTSTCPQRLSLWSHMFPRLTPHPLSHLTLHSQRG